MTCFGERLYELRKKKGISQEDLANAVGTTKSNISKYENKNTEPTLESAKKISDYLMVSLDWLAGEEIKEVPTNITNQYKQIIDIAITNNISPNKLNKAIEFILEMRID